MVVIFMMLIAVISGAKKNTSYIQQIKIVCLTSEKKKGLHNLQLECYIMIILIAQIRKKGEKKKNST